MCYKKGSDLYSIPSKIPFTYTPPQIDSVLQSMQVQPTRTTRQAKVETIEEAVQLYLEAFGEQFIGENGVHKKSLYLGRFVTFLMGQGQSMKLADLTLEDGQAFWGFTDPCISWRCHIIGDEEEI